MKLNKFVKALAITVATGVSMNAAADAKVDPNLPTYEKTSGISGNLTSIGSDTLANMMSHWVEDFEKFYPAIKVEVSAAGSSTAPPALTKGTSHIGPMSRMMKEKEIEEFEKRFNYKPTAVPVAIDALAVFVNKDNPVKGLNMHQLDAIFSSTRKCGYKEDVTTWGQVGVSGSLGGQQIQLYGRNSVSGTYGYFKKKALCKGDFKNNVNESPGSSSVVSGISASINGIGYSGIGYKTPSVRALPIAKKGSSKYVEATPENAVNRKYPLSRLLYVYVNKAPNKALEPKVAEFLKMVLSQKGQHAVVKDGYVPLPAKIANKARKELGL